ncbi:MAG: THUMP domain-containing protein [Candidatus Latescibacterota bacterium]
MHFDFLATTLPGLGEILADEIRSIGIVPKIIEDDGVIFNETPHGCMMANICLRTAEHIIMLLSEFDCFGTEDLYEQVCIIDWKPWFRDHQTLSVSAVVQDSSITHSVNAALAVKDAISEALRDKSGQLLEVDRYSPDISVMLRLNKNHARIGIDTSGESLGHRGFSLTSHNSPLMETLAAGLVLASGWNGLDDLYIPFCGVGSIAVEAGLFARNIPPNSTRRKFAFMKLPWFDPTSFEKIVENSRSHIVPGECMIEASDEDGSALRVAGEYAASAELSGIVRFVERGIKELPNVRPASFLITSPPSHTAGSTEITALRSLYRTVGEVFRKRMRKSTAWVFTNNGALSKYISLKPSDKMIIHYSSFRFLYLRYNIK